MPQERAAIELACLVDARADAEQRHIAVVGAESAQLKLERVDLLVERLDQGEARLEGSAPWLGQLEPVEQVAAAAGEEVAGRAGLAVRDQRLVDPLLEHRAVLDEVHPEACSL